MKAAPTFPQMSQGKSPPSWWTRPWRLSVEESENDMWQKGQRYLLGKCTVLRWYLILERQCSVLRHD